MEKTYECLKEILEEQIKLISKKGDKITPEEVLSLKNSLSSIEKINELMREEEYSEGYARGYHEGYSYGEMRNPNRSPVTGRYISNGPMHGNVRMSYGNDRMYGNSGNSGTSNGTSYGSEGNDHMYGHSIKDRMIARLESMFDEAKTDHERQIVANTINRIQSDN